MIIFSFNTYPIGLYLTVILEDLTHREFSYGNSIMLRNKLTLLAPNLWIFDQPHRFLGIEIGVRMTIVRLETGDLFLHSPIQLTCETCKHLDAIAPVRYVVAPNRFHHVYLKDYFSAYPKTEIIAARGLQKKRSDLSFNGALTDGKTYGCQDGLKHLVFGGMPMLNEVVFFHISSHTLILTDLICNFRAELPMWTKIFVWLDGVYENFGVPRVERYLLIRSREQAKSSIDKILSWEFDRVIMAHGQIMQKRGHPAIEKAFEWL